MFSKFAYNCEADAPHAAKIYIKKNERKLFQHFSILQ